MPETELLTVAEHSALAECETVIERGMHTFVEVGQALLKVREERLYRAEYGTFEDYLDKRWQISARRGQQLMQAAAVARTIVRVAPELPPVANEGQARELARVPEEQRAEVWQRVIETTDGKPTAAAIREVVSPAPQTPEWGTPEARDADIVGCPVDRQHIATREAFEKVGGCPYCLRAPDERARYLQEEHMPTPSPQVDAPTPAEAQRIEEFRREYAAAEPDRDLARRQRVATDLLDRHVYNLSLIGESPEVANYLPALSSNPISQPMLDRAEGALEHIRKTFTEKGLL